NISYSIKFNDIELNHLSPGLKGLALIILFLELDQEDKRPILIDQPEENLDNRSVYHTLVRYFRNAKKRRQVIIATHNPNLVVNTDSEQVIVANFDRGLESQESRVSYVSGSLENTFKDDASNLLLEKQGIREHVCEILEGGKDAFEKREQKYGFA
ncbi:AAA family ATPase, partial [Thermodesulfovibrio yellowstonii]